MDFLEIVFLAIFFILVIAMIFLQDWLLYKLRGRTLGSYEPGSPVITGPEDASAHRVLDLWPEDK